MNSIISFLRVGLDVKGDLSVNGAPKMHNISDLNH